jgi:hypothetical protein
VIEINHINLFDHFFNNLKLTIMKLNLWMVILLVAAFASCKEEEKDFFATTTDFDQKAFESKVFALGDTVKIDFLLNFNLPQDGLRTGYIIGNRGFEFEKKSIDPSLKSYLYKFRFPLDPQIFKSVNQTGIDISTSSSDPKVQGGAIPIFLIKFK